MEPLFRHRTLAVLLLLESLAVSRGERLRWDDTNRPGQVRSWTIFVSGPLPSATVRQVTVTTNEIDVGLLLQGAPSGIYSAYGISTGVNGVSSSKSSSILIPWTSPTDPSLSGPQGCSRVAERRENTGIVVQTFQDQAHSFGATACQLTTTGTACKLELNLRKFNQPTGDITFYVWENARNRPGALIATGRTTIDASKITEGWYETSIRFQHAAGQICWIGLSATAVNPQNNILWLGGGSGSRFYSADGRTWVYSSSDAMNFRISDE